MQDKHDNLFFWCLGVMAVSACGLVYASSHPAVSLALVIGLSAASSITGYIAGLDDEKS